MRLHCLLLMPAQPSLFVHTKCCSTFPEVQDIIVRMYCSAYLPFSFADLLDAACFAAVTPVIAKTAVARLAAGVVCGRHSNPGTAADCTVKRGKEVCWYNINNIK